MRPTQSVKSQSRRSIFLPIRSRSHELEDESIERFKGAIPRRWVCREKSRDYGVDLEVEIFAEDRTATGLMFYVQLKATDDIEREQKTSMEVDRISYLQGLELPAVVVRYCSPTGRLFWVWDFEAASQATPPAKSATIAFANEWTGDTPNELSRLLRVLRRLGERRQNERFSLATRYDVCYSTQLIASQALHEMAGQLPFIRYDEDETRLPFEISFSLDRLRITLGRGYLDLPANYESPAEVRKTLAYGLAAVLMRAGFSDRAATTANYCLSLGDAYTTIRRELSIYACIALRGDPLKATRLAIHAGLHHQQDEIFVAFTAELNTGGSAERSEVAKAIEEYYLPAINLAPTLESRGAIMYSLGNVRYNNDEHAKAVAAYNSARKLRPEYMKSDYFFRELGGTFYNARKFRWAVSAYRRALELTPDSETIFCLGDALLYNGDFKEASSILASVADVESVSLSANARLKWGLADWFSESGDRPSPRNVDEILQYTNELDTQEKKFPAILASAFASRNDSFLWSWAIHLSVVTAGISIAADVVLCAQEACGSEAYAMCRERALPLMEDETDLKQLDDLHMEAQGLVASAPRRPFLARVLAAEGTRVLEKLV
jgi:tetratricopeptide (TPR) repeat protein